MSSYGKTVVLGPGEGQEFTLGADRVLIKGLTDQAGGGFSVVEYHGAANNPGPPLHVHHTFETLLCHVKAPSASRRRKTWRATYRFRQRRTSALVLPSAARRWT